MSHHSFKRIDFEYIYAVYVLYNPIYSRAV